METKLWVCLALVFVGAALASAKFVTPKDGWQCNVIKVLPADKSGKAKCETCCKQHNFGRHHIDAVSRKCECSEPLQLPCDHLEVPRSSTFNEQTTKCSECCKEHGFDFYKNMHPGREGICHCTKFKKGRK